MSPRAPQYAVHANLRDLLTEAAAAVGQDRLHAARESLVAGVDEIDRTLGGNVADTLPPAPPGEDPPAPAADPTTEPAPDADAPAADETEEPSLIRELREMSLDELRLYASEQEINLKNAKKAPAVLKAILVEIEKDPGRFGISPSA